MNIEKMENNLYKMVIVKEKVKKLVLLAHFHFVVKPVILHNKISAIYN